MNIIQYFKLILYQSKPKTIIMETENDNISIDLTDIKKCIF